MPKPVTTTPPTVEEQLGEILEHLRRMDARDRLRTWGGFVRGIIAIVPLILLLWSGWYFVKHGEELMKMIADTAASSAADYTKSQGQGLYEQMMKQYSTPPSTK
ncbi:MAG: hypothetical protein KBA40_04040 [Candidatus Peribacteraceae bacterium]|nr:hypothetical protein [Candidatus Peribacteraceae bacterium]